MRRRRVADFFHSVQLNVNNPHFLIMQGVITKVLNMKPPEILSLLEEASGTRMYEKKKEVALRTLEKKEAKIAEIDNVSGTWQHVHCTKHAPAPFTQPCLMDGMRAIVPASRTLHCMGLRAK